MVMYEDCMASRCLLWVAIDDADGMKPKGFITTKIIDYPKVKMCSQEYCAGEEATAWFLDLQALVERWAQDQGCAGCEMVGRKGWTRKFPQAGWTDRYTMAVKMFPTS